MNWTYKAMVGFSTSIIIAFFVILGIGCVVCYDGTYVETKEVQAEIIESKTFGYDLEVVTYCEELDQELHFYRSRFLNVYAAKHIGETITVTADMYERFGKVVCRKATHHIDEEDLIVELKDGSS